jgi:hypothetical protein
MGKINRALTRTSNRARAFLKGKTFEKRAHHDTYNKPTIEEKIDLKLI